MDKNHSLDIRITVCWRSEHNVRLFLPPQIEISEMFKIQVNYLLTSFKWTTMYSIIIRTLPFLPPPKKNTTNSKMCNDFDKPIYCIDSHLKVVSLPDSMQIIYRKMNECNGQSCCIWTHFLITHEQYIYIEQNYETLFKS